MSRLRWVVVVLVLAGAGVALAALLAGRWPAPAASPPTAAAASTPRAPANVVVIVVDTLRADHLSAYGYGRATSPNLDAFAAGSVLFERARSQSTCTFPSVNSLLTSRWPATFLGQPEERLGIPPGVPSLAEMLRAEGYSTMAVSASPIVRATPSSFNPEGGFGRGFDLFSEECEWKSALCVHEQLAGGLERLAPPFFLYLHYMEPHGPYRPPPGYRRRFAGGYPGPHDFIAKGDPNPIASMLYKSGPRYEIAPGDLAHLIDLYDEEIAFFDARFPELLALVDRAAAGSDTLIALVSDHGEAFLEHGDVKHCRAPYDTLLHTPMILRIPGGPAGFRVTAPVMNLDLVPTLLDLLGVDPGGPLAGRSLRPLLEGVGGSAPERRHAFGAYGVWKTVADRRFKLLFRMRKPRTWELYDLAADPGETRDVQGDFPQDLERLRRELFAWVQGVEEDAEGGLAAAEQAHRRLEALGYLE